MTQFAIAQGGRVLLWCRAENDGRFWVINGAWEGRLVEGGFRVDRTKDEVAGEIVWRGTAPFRDHEYNHAIAWIEEQL